MGPGESLIAALGLSPHPEGGWYRRTWESPVTLEGRPIGSAILYLLLAGEQSAPHRIDATEIWHFYAGSPLTLTLDEVAGPATVVTLGPDVAAGQQPQHVVDRGVWQSARPTGAYSLAGATVCPAFMFEGFELRPPGVGPR
jgi:uncharacterized protein